MNKNCEKIAISRNCRNNREGAFYNFLACAHNENLNEIYALSNFVHKINCSGATKNYFSYNSINIYRLNGHSRASFINASKCN